MASAVAEEAAAASAPADAEGIWVLDPQKYEAWRKNIDPGGASGTRRRLVEKQAPPGTFDAMVAFGVARAAGPQFEASGEAYPLHQSWPKFSAEVEKKVADAEAIGGAPKLESFKEWLERDAQEYRELCAEKKRKLSLQFFEAQDQYVAAQQAYCVDEAPKDAAAKAKDAEAQVEVDVAQAYRVAKAAAQAQADAAATAKASKAATEEAEAEGDVVVVKGDAAVDPTAATQEDTEPEDDAVAAPTALELSNQHGVQVDMPAQVIDLLENDEETINEWVAGLQADAEDLEKKRRWAEEARQSRREKRVKSEIDARRAQEQKETRETELNMLEDMGMLDVQDATARLKQAEDGLKIAEGEFAAVQGKLTVARALHARRKASFELALSNSIT